MIRLLYSKIYIIHMYYDQKLLLWEKWNDNEQFMNL